MSATVLKENNSTYDDQLSMSLKLAENNRLEAQRLALDCAQLLSVKTHQADAMKQQGFFQRLCKKFTGQQSVETINTNTLFQIQQKAFRYIELLNHNNLMVGESIITVKNQLNYIKADNIETKKAITQLAQKIKSKFESLERRIERLEVTTAIHGWLLTIEEFDYVRRFPKHMRLLNIVKDFRDIKTRDWTIDDIRCLKNAIRKSGIDPDETITIRQFLSGIAVENYPDKYSSILNHLLMVEDVDVKRVKTEVALPMLTAMYQFADQYVTNTGVIKRIVEKYPNIPAEQTVADIMVNIVQESGIDTEAETEYEHLALELLTGVNLAQYFASKKGFICSSSECLIHKQQKHYISPGFCQECGKPLQLDK